MLITFFVKKPFQVGIRENFIFQFIDAERAMAYAPTSQKTNTILLIVFELVSFKALSHLAINKLVVKMIVWHLSGEVNTISTRATSVIRILKKELITF